MSDFFDQTAATNPNGDSNSFDNIFAALVQVVIIASSAIFRLWWYPG